MAHPRRPRGSQSGRERKRATKVFKHKCYFPLFTLAQLTAPGSPRMPVAENWPKF